MTGAKTKMWVNGFGVSHPTFKKYGTACRFTKQFGQCEWYELCVTPSCLILATLHGKDKWHRL